MTTNISMPSTTDMQLLVAASKDARKIPGRRDWVDYRDFGVEAASAGLISTHRVTVTPQEGNSDKVKQTGWHYHDCVFQWVYLIEGWVDVHLEDGSSCRHEAGSVVFIPGGYGHNEVNASERIDLIEIFMPPHPETVAIDVPESWRGRE
jgi:mannose-6-phosphate isomerase-like protein (cupin superfamily)